MCGRLVLSAADLQRFLDLIGVMLEEKVDVNIDGSVWPRYNVAPTQSHFQIRLVDGTPTLERSRWGWLRSIGKPKEPGALPPTKLIFNTVSETAPEKTMYKKALRERRCLIPATGFYEWVGPKSQRTPVHFTRADKKLLLFAGIYDEAKEEELPRFSILTTGPNATLKPIHDRMPAILCSTADAHAWLTAPGSHLLQPAPDDLLIGTPANAIVNRTGQGSADGPECLEPPERTLF